MFRTMFVICVILATTTLAIGQPPMQKKVPLPPDLEEKEEKKPPLPPDLKEKEKEKKQAPLAKDNKKYSGLGADLAILKKRMAQMTGRMYEHDEFSFSAYIENQRLGDYWREEAEKTAKEQTKDPSLGNTKIVDELKGCTFTAMKSTAFSHVIFHFKDTTGKMRAVGKRLNDSEKLTRDTVEAFLWAVQNEELINGQEAQKLSKLKPKKDE